MKPFHTVPHSHLPFHITSHILTSSHAITVIVSHLSFKYISREMEKKKRKGMWGRWGEWHYEVLIWLCMLNVSHSLSLGERVAQIESALHKVLSFGCEVREGSGGELLYDREWKEGIIFFPPLSIHTCKMASPPRSHLIPCSSIDIPWENIE